MDIRFDFPPDEENIELIFPVVGENIDLGATISFDEIVGTLPLSRTDGELPVNRLEGFDGIMTEEEAHELWNET